MADANTRVSKNDFPCENCPLVISKKYPNCEFKFVESGETEEMLLVLEKGNVIKEEPVAKMTPGCRFCKGYYNHVINSLVFYAEVIWQ